MIHLLLRCLGMSMAAAVVLTACATPTPPAAPTVAELAQPHHLVIGASAQPIRVDAGEPATQVTALPLTPVGLVVGLATTTVINAIAQHNANRRVSRAQELAEALQGEAAAGEFAAELQAAIRRIAAAEPRMRIASVESIGRAAATDTRPMQPRQPAVILGGAEAVLTRDARAVVARAVVTHNRPIGVEGPASVFRNLVVFSEPVEAPTEEEAIALWRADDHRLLRQRARDVALELAELVRMELLDPSPAASDSLPEVGITTPGVFVVLGKTAEGREHGKFLPGRSRGRLVRQVNGRAHLSMGLGEDGTMWTWVSVPTSALERRPGG